MFFDTVIVGAGPAGLSAAIRLKQKAVDAGKEISVCVVEKGSEVGAHILSGNVFETTAMDELFPDWRKDIENGNGPPIQTKAKEDKFLVLTGSTSSVAIPNFLLPSELHNDGNYIISLSQLTRWLGTKAEELGVEIYPGFAASEVLYDASGAVVLGVATKDAGVAKDRQLKDTFARGVELLARQTLFAEGARGSCSEEVIDKFSLRQPGVHDVQSYGLGIKEVWQVPSDTFRGGYIQHTLGYPLQASPFSDVFGGTFLYHMEPDLVVLGMVVGLDYKNPYMNPYKEFQRWKHHPAVAEHLRGGDCISYGARCINEGGYHAIPKLTVPGAALVGCAAGFLNAVKIKGTHTAMKSGMLAADALFPRLVAGDVTVASSPDGGAEFFPLAQGAESGAGAVHVVPIEITSYELALRDSWVGKELYALRNTHAAFHYGTLAGMLHTAFSCFVSRGREPWSLRNTVPDSACTQPAKGFSDIPYPKPDNKLSFDLLTNLARSGTSHEHDQPSHLVVRGGLEHVPSEVSITQFAGPEQRFCPAGVYEYAEQDGQGRRALVINAQNCVHCKCCAIKAPRDFVKWTVPEGGGGPAYTVM